MASIQTPSRSSSRGPQKQTSDEAHWCLFTTMKFKPIGKSLLQILLTFESLLGNLRFNVWSIGLLLSIHLWNNAKFNIWVNFFVKWFLRPIELHIHFDCGNWNITNRILVNHRFSSSCMFKYIKKVKFWLIEYKRYINILWNPSFWHLLSTIYMYHYLLGMKLNW
jgi:hypothetical protein